MGQKAADEAPARVSRAELARDRAALARFLRMANGYYRPRLAARPFAALACPAGADPETVRALEAVVGRPVFRRVGDGSLAERKLALEDTVAALDAIFQARYSLPEFMDPVLAREKAALRIKDISWRDEAVHNRYQRDVTALEDAACDECLRGFRLWARAVAPVDRAPAAATKRPVLARLRAWAARVRGAMQPPLLYVDMLEYGEFIAELLAAGTDRARLQAATRVYQADVQRYCDADRAPPEHA